MLIYRLVQAEGDENSKEWVQLSLIIGSGGEVKQKIIRVPKIVFLQMASNLKHGGLPYTKVEE